MQEVPSGASSNQECSDKSDGDVDVWYDIHFSSSCSKYAILKVEKYTIHMLKAPSGKPKSHVPSKKAAAKEATASMA